ncbi:DNA-binding response regulator [Vallitalea longa]|uniref:Stage 0 sporulation protein A homolog n=1 Tax=Vallitalea longa TaxID=2936439 RepID=A0A9W5YCJ7_9FIRM|nr:response regulator [Vallitalea longa]GKX30110.1 DNA-binding response regulator [Vallitalea longa]
MKKWKVMLIDDEIMVIEDLMDIIDWEANGFTIVAKTTSSREGLSLYKKYEPDIIFIDINMPVINGLELTKKITKLSNNKNIQIFILTAYSDFNYAKEAIGLGVCDYLLKHEISHDSLLDNLKKAANNLEKNDVINSVISKDVISCLIKGKQLSSELENYYRVLVKYKVSLLLFDIKDDMEIEDNNILDQISKDDRNSLKIKQSLIITDRNRKIICIIRKKVNSNSKIQECLYLIALKIGRYINKNKYTYSMVLFRKSCQLGELKDNARYVKDCMEYLFYLAENKIIWDFEVPKKELICKERLEGISQKLVQVLESKVIDDVDIFFSNLHHDLIRYYGSNNMFHIIETLTKTIEKYAVDHNIDPDKYINNYNEKETMFIKINDVTEYYKKTYKRIIKDVLEQKLYSKKVYEAILYIHDNYKKPLTVDKVAKYLDISGVYLSLLLKKELNKTFTTILTEYRITMALKMMDEGNYKIYEISEAVGYKTSQYFSKVFKKIVGTSPLEYKK